MGRTKGAKFKIHLAVEIVTSGTTADSSQVDKLISDIEYLPIEHTIPME